MPKVTQVDDKTAVTVLTLPNGLQKRLHFHEDQKATHVTVISSDPNIVKPSAHGPKLFSGPLGIWTIDLKASKTGDAKITIARKDGVSAALQVRVTDPLPVVKLPADNLDAGLVSRLFLSEVATPDDQNYSAEDALKSMRWMKLVLFNRLKAPHRFRAAGAKHIRAIVRAPGQFRGFESYPKFAAGVHNHIARTLKIANDASHPLQSDYRAFVQNAIDVATSADNIQDPSTNGLIGWRTSGSNPPGGDFRDFGVPLLGNQFYEWSTQQ